MKVKDNIFRHNLNVIFQSYDEKLEDLSSELFDDIFKEINNRIKQTKQEKAKEIFDDLENLWCEKNNGTFTIYGYNELKKKHLGK